MATDADLARRMFRARHEREGQLGRPIALREIGEEVSALLGREEPYDPSIIARWLKGQQEPGTRAQWIALARVLRVDVGWLAFGEASAAPMARDYPPTAAPAAGSGPELVPGTRRVIPPFPLTPVDLAKEVAKEAGKEGAKKPAKKKRA